MRSSFEDGKDKDILETLNIMNASWGFFNMVCDVDIDES